MDAETVRIRNALRNNMREKREVMKRVRENVQGNRWDCSRCTLTNCYDENICGACGHPRDLDSAEAPSSDRNHRDARLRDGRTFLEAHRQRRQVISKLAESDRNPRHVRDLPSQTITRRDVERMPAESQECGICLESFAAGDRLRTLPCFHRFHACCVDEWLRQSAECPLCKHQVDKN